MVEDIIYAFTCFHAGVEVLDVAFDELIVWIVFEQIDVGLLTCAEVVETANAIAEVENGFAQVGADEAGAACNEKQRIIGECEVLVHDVFDDCFPFCLESSVNDVARKGALYVKDDVKGLKE